MSVHSLPDFRSLGVMLRALLGANLLALAAALIRVDEIPQALSLYVQFAALLEPALLFTLTSLFVLQPWLQRRNYWLALGVIVSLALLITLSLHVALAGPLPQAATVDFFRVTLLTLLVVAFLLGYFDLRARALGPAHAEARLQALQARIRPHFLFNSLNAVLGMIRTDPRRAETALEDMAELFRALMRDSRQLTSLADEVSLTMRYVELEQFRLGERLQVQWDLADMPGDAQVPALLLQPLLENAVYHGIEPNSEPGVVTVRVSRHRDGVELVVDNPVALAAPASHGNKLALDNIRERLLLHFDVEAQLRLERVGARHRVTIILPYRREH